MSHELYEINGGESMGYANAVPWHGLGQSISADADLETWRKEARLDWEYLRTPALFSLDGGPAQNYPGRDILCRSDNGHPLSIVSSNYKEVQPADILEFYRELINTAGFKMETAGSLHDGKKIWALAKTGDVSTIKRDRIQAYLLLATSCDASMATVAQFTSVRVVCHNTLDFAVARSKKDKPEYAVKVPHSKTFNADEVKSELGLAHESFQNFTTQTAAMMEQKVSNKDAVNFLIKVMGDEEKPVEEQPRPRQIARCVELFNGGAIGSSMASADGTLWGLLNAVTQYADHDRSTRTTDSRLDSAWFGEFNRIKRRALEEALVMVK